MEADDLKMEKMILRDAIIRVLGNYEEEFQVTKFRKELIAAGICDEFVDQFINDLDADQSGILTKDECTRFLAKDSHSAAFKTLDSNNDGNLHADEFRFKMRELGITDDRISELITKLDRDQDGKLTEAETSKFLDRTKFLSLTDPRFPGGWEIGDTALRAIELAQLEKLYEHMENELSQKSEGWEVTRYVNGDPQKVNLTNPKKFNLYDMNGDKFPCLICNQLRGGIAAVTLCAADHVILPATFHGLFLQDLWKGSNALVKPCRCCISFRFHP